MPSGSPEPCRVSQGGQAVPTAHGEANPANGATVEFWSRYGGGSGWESWTQTEIPHVGANALDEQKPMATQPVWAADEETVILRIGGNSSNRVGILFLASG